MPGRRIALSRHDFAAVASHKGSKRLSGPYFSITSSEKGVGTAVVVSKKVAKSAAQRHLLKRRVREALYRQELPPAALIVYAKAGAAGRTFEEIKEEITPLLAKLLPESVT
jgi:ribonuclease P protein component